MRTQLALPIGCPKFFAATYQTRNARYTSFRAASRTATRRASNGWQPGPRGTLVDGS